MKGQFDVFGTFSRQSRSERLIAAGRFAVAAVGFFGVLVRPPGTRGAALVEALLAMYLLYAVFMALRAWQVRDVPPQGIQIGTHITDLLLAAILQDVTGGATSPFFPLLAFPLLAATVRWYRWGTLYTGAASLTLYVLITAHAEPRFVFEVDFALRAAYLVVATALLSYLGAGEKRAQREIAALAAWLDQAVGPGEERLSEALRHAAAVLGTPRLLVVSVEPDQTWLKLALWEHERLTLSQEPPAALETLVAEPLAASDFFCADAADPDSRVRCVSPTEHQWRGAPLHPKLQSAFNIRGVMAVRLRGGLVDGRVFVLDRRSPTTEDMALAAIVARQIEHQLALGYLTRIQQDAAVARERGRVARDVHDGVLQSLTSVALRLETIRRQLESRPPEAAAGIQQLQSMVLVEQQSLREFVRYLQGDQAHADSGLSELLTELVLRLEREWRVRMKLTILLESNRLNTLIPASLAREIYQLVREALVNVGRHARASQAWVTLDASDDEVFLMVADDGVGFGFQGTQERTQLVRRGHGPKMLLARVAVLGGSLSIGSSPAGARVVIKVPLGR